MIFLLKKFVKRIISLLIKRKIDKYNKIIK